MTGSDEKRLTIPCEGGALMGQWLLLHLADIVSHPNQLRKAFDPKATREVSDCIKAVGVNMSITVHPHEEKEVSKCLQITFI